jgi:NAD(P)-dependent dehydrogenase (short-subunit alcohol dehydrogenase family)
VLLADFNETTLHTAATALEDAGHTVTTQRVDVSDRKAVHALAQTAADLGNVVAVVSTAGVSPVQASAQAVLAVDLYGTALVLEEFGAVIAPGGAEPFERGIERMRLIRNDISTRVEALGEQLGSLRS